MTPSNSFIRLPMTDEQYEKLKSDNAAEFKRLCENEHLSKIAWPIYFMSLGVLLGFMVGFLFA